MEQDFDVTNELEEIGVTPDVVATIKKTVKELKEKDTTIEVVHPIAIQGNPKRGDKPLYVGYFREPNFKIFSKYLVASAQNQAGAMRSLARECFLDGDKELVDKDSLFLFGLMGQLSKIIEMRNGTLVNL